MAIHDWTRVDAGIFHAFHHSWIEELARALNLGLLPAEYYALAEQFAGGFGPDVLTLQGPANGGANGSDNPQSGAPRAGGSVCLAPPKLQVTDETDMAFYRRKQKAIVVRHVSGDEVVAVIEVVSPGNKAARNPLRSFLQKAAQLLDHGVHLLVVDLVPPGPRDPQGIHAEIWREIAGKDTTARHDKPLTLAAYEAGDVVRAYVVSAAVGEPLTDMPLFLEPGQSITVPLDATYNAAYAFVPRRWCQVLETPAG